MANEILAVKLCELDEKLGKMHSRIIFGESVGADRLKQEIEQLERECTETELALRQKLRFSKASCITLLSKAYEEIEKIMAITRADLEVHAKESGDADISAEEQILLAEYALDFALQAADRALLLSLKATQAQAESYEQKERS